MTPRSLRRKPSLSSCGPTTPPPGAHVRLRLHGQLRRHRLRRLDPGDNVLFDTTDPDWIRDSDPDSHGRARRSGSMIPAIPFGEHPKPAIEPGAVWDIDRARGELPQALWQTSWTQRNNSRCWPLQTRVDAPADRAGRALREAQVHGETLQLPMEDFLFSALLRVEQAPTISEPVRREKILREIGKEFSWPVRGDPGVSSLREACVTSGSCASGARSWIRAGDRRSLARTKS
jgi:hypothetical protein